MSRHIVVPSARLEGELEAPGDKSISHRAVMVASGGYGPCAINGLSPADDVRRTVEVVTALGVRVTSPNSQVEDDERSTLGISHQILVEGRGFEGLSAPEHVLDCGNSGTTMRTILGILAGRPIEATLDGDASLRSRPMLRVVNPLRRMGAVIEGRDGGEHAPLTIRGASLQGMAHGLLIPSAQVKTAILYAGLQAQGETSVREPARSRDHTERLLKFLGVQVEETVDRLIIKSTEIQNASSLEVPGDLSSAAFLLVAAAILPGSHVRLTNVGVNPTRTGILDALRSFGAQVTVASEREICGEPRATLEVRAADRRPIQVGGEAVASTVDELPLVAVLGAVAEGETVVTGAEELRLKESDRIASMVRGLEAMGADVQTLPDGFRIRGGRPLRGAAVDAAGDHRVAMALAVAALAAAGPTSIEGWESVTVSYPGFAQDVAGLRVP